MPPTPDLCLVPGGFWQDTASTGLALGSCVLPLEGRLWLSGKRHMDARPLQEHGQDWCQKRSILGDQMLHLQFRCKPSSFAQVSAYCLLTVSPEIPLSQWRSTLNQMSDAFFEGVMTPSLLPAGPDAQHMLDPSSLSVVWFVCRGRSFLVVFHRHTNTARRHNNRTGTSGN